ncbi:putative late blight resistance protein homolog R1A-10 [Henckelia pumila]|uniref:putative late blight resistance protein homolog R1A-10 n=1 Tax=Henckelia pumila TaxID=405737 RepID=UPI003C6DF975
MDDMWHKEAWDNIKRLLPDDNEGSRVLLTTRLSEVATHANWFSPDHHHMRLLNENEGWKLLCSKIFGDGRFIPELEAVGKEIVRSCKGLPLSIVVVSGLLSNISRTQREWGYIAKNLNQILISKDSHCTKVFSLSYDHMPHHLKACFLYTGVYPQDFEIPMSKLIKLWIAEGFIKMNSSKSLEEVGEEYLEDLVSRNLVMVGEKRFNGKIKSCIVHDLLKEWCSSKALDEKFIHTLNANIYYCQEIAKDPRRLCIRKLDSTDEARADILRTIGTFSLVRSLVSQSKPHDELWCCKLLRVLDLSNVDLEFFPSGIIDLIHLRYVYLCCELCNGIHISKYLPDSLRDLQTLIIRQRCIDSSVYLPRGIWGMRHLRHLQFGTCCFPHPLEGDKNLVLENLQTLSYVSGSSCTEEFIKRIPNAKKLGIRVKTRDEQKAFSLRHLMNLHKLEILKCIVEPTSCIIISKDLTLPKNLIKLTLSGTKISWKDMPIVGSLPNLEVLKLKNNAFQGLEWEPIKGEFCRYEVSTY